MNIVEKVQYFAPPWDSLSHLHFSGFPTVLKKFPDVLLAAFLSLCTLSHAKPSQLGLGQLVKLPLRSLEVSLESLSCWKTNYDPTNLYFIIMIIKTKHLMRSVSKLFTGVVRRRWVLSSRKAAISKDMVHQVHGVYIYWLWVTFSYYILTTIFWRGSFYVHLFLNWIVSSHP